ncbi:cobalamin biosynthesis protein CobW [Streptomyces mashuensis]|uniref:Cobalamin biosynthesis protein CobW n=1 Tax=Streptomyces mashuensis TaxID=33904 RepID=A0A919B8K4_9ACTN|nr:GTP-binding protein [Streptomyces mashuensis]GHF62925.1 cobalamin biosynthesis protein CobW [Streptomyces mashuensis]
MNAVSPAGRGPLPVVLVGGLHADARAAVVQRLLETVPGSLALHHDLAVPPGAETVRRTVRDRFRALGAADVPLVNGCGCCALREDLLPELRRLADTGVCRLAVVELWDSVEPRGVAEAVAAHGAGGGSGFRLTGVLTAVDPAFVLPYLACGDDLAETGLAVAVSDRRTVGDTFARQVEYVSVLALADGPEAAEPADHALLAQTAPAARQVRAGSVDLVAAAFGGFDTEAAAARAHPACALLPQEAREHGVATLVWRADRPFHPGRLYAALEDLTCAAARSRGRFWLADRPDTLLAWDAAGGALCVENAGPWLAALPEAAWEMVPAERRVAAALDWHPEHGDRGQHLTFTAPGLDTDGLRELLGSCLLTDAEYAGGPAAWRHLPPAFDELLAPVS